MNMVEEQCHLMNHRLEVEGMDMVGIHIVEVEERPSNHRPEVKGMDMKDSDMWEDMLVDVQVVEREHEDGCGRDIGPAMERRGISELIESGRSL
jgi:hypothetical protein